MGQYAKSSTVTSERSRQEIERILTRYGATQFMYGWHDTGAVIAFVAHNRQVRFKLTYPSRSSDEFLYTETGRERTSESQLEKLYEQAIRQRWRALALMIKAKLEGVDSGIVVFEEEFLAHIVLPGTDSTVAEVAIPRLAQSYDSGKALPLLPA